MKLCMVKVHIIMFTLVECILYIHTHTGSPLFCHLCVVACTVGAWFDSQGETRGSLIPWPPPQASQPQVQ